MAFQSFARQAERTETPFISGFSVCRSLATAITLLANGVNNAIAPLDHHCCFVSSTPATAAASPAFRHCLADRFGMESISTIHGLALSAWAFAGLIRKPIERLHRSERQVPTTTSFMSCWLCMQSRFFISAVHAAGKTGRKKKTSRPSLTQRIKILGCLVLRQPRILWFNGVWMFDPGFEFMAEFPSKKALEGNLVLSSDVFPRQNGFGGEFLSINSITI